MRHTAQSQSQCKMQHRSLTTIGTDFCRVMVATAPAEKLIGHHSVRTWTQLQNLSHCDGDGSLQLSPDPLAVFIGLLLKGGRVRPLT